MATLSSRPRTPALSAALQLLLAAIALPGALLAHEGGPIFSPEGEGGFFIRGDSDQNGEVEIADAIGTLAFLFLGGDLPYCLDALDANDDGSLDLTDAIATLGFLFLGHAAIPAPYPAAGLDPSPDGLGCDNGRFAYIRRQVLAVSCSSLSCHSSLVAKGGLTLEGPQAYSQLFQTLSVNDVARAAGLKRVAPGHPEKSFLYLKLTGALAAGEGDPMPQVGVSLNAEKLELIRHWIADGAAPSTADDIMLPLPFRGEQIFIPPFAVPSGLEVQRNYYFKLKSQNDLWVNHVEFLYPPGSHHLNLFSGAPSAFPDGSFEDNFKVVPFGDWNLRASSQSERLDWRLPPGVAVKFVARQQLLAQIHFVNVGSQTSPIGGCAAINLHAVDPATVTSTLGSMFLQNKNIVIPPQSEVSFDYGITLGHYGYNVPVKVAAVTGHFHWRGKTFEIRRWDGLDQNPDGSPAPGEFDRMGKENTIFFSDNWDEPPFNLFGADGPELPAGWGVVYRTTYVNTTDQKFCFGPHVANQEHANAFLYFYPGPANGDFFWFPPDCVGQGCTVPCQ